MYGEKTTTKRNYRAQKLTCRLLLLLLFQEVSISFQWQDGKKKTEK